MTRAPVPSASCITSSPPTTSDSLLASARSIPSPSVATVGPRPAEPTIALSTRSAPESITSSTRPAAPPSTSPSNPSRASRGGILVGERDPPTPARPRLLDERLPVARGAEAGDLDVVGATDDVERLNADRARRAENQNAPHCATV